MLLQLSDSIKIKVNPVNNEVHVLSSKINYMLKPDVALQRIATEIRKLGYSGQISGMVDATNILRRLSPQSAENLSYLYSYYFIKKLFNADKSLVFKIFNTGLESSMNHYGKIYEPKQTIFRVAPLIKVEFMDSAEGFVETFEDFSGV